jgi:serine/threonine-protein kinase
MQGKSISGYTLQRLLGTGGMAEVWYAENKIGKKAAVKILLPKLCADDSVKSRFYTEAKVMVELDHPNIRQVYDYGDIEGRPAIVMEYLEGDDLKTMMKRGRRFGDEELKKWWNQLVSALNYTHQKGIVHRDIKPGNIFVNKRGDIKLLDFGIAKVRESISSTQTGQKLGTLMYMSPEQVLDSKHVDYRTDIYSLAVTFVHLISGKRPYDSDTSSDFEISEQIVYKPLDLSGLPELWRSFLTPFLSKDPNQRKDLVAFTDNGFGNASSRESDETYVETSSVTNNSSIDATIKAIEELQQKGAYKEAYNRCLELIKHKTQLDYANKKIEELLPLLKEKSKKSSRKRGLIVAIVVFVIYLLYIIILSL